MIVFFLPRKMYPKSDEGIYVVEDGVLPLSNNVDVDVLYGLVLDGLISLNDFHKICCYNDVFDLVLHGDIFEYIAEHCWLSGLEEKLMNLKTKFFHIIRIAPTFSILNVLKNFEGRKVIDISFLSSEQLKYVYRFLREDDVLVSHYFRLDVLNLCDKLVLHRDVECQYYVYSKLTPAYRDKTFDRFGDKSYAVYDLTGGIYSIIDEEYEFIELEKKKFVKKKVDYHRFKEIFELLDEVVKNAGIMSFKTIYEMLGNLDVLVKALNHGLLEHRQGQIIVTDRGLNIYVRFKECFEGG